MAWAKLDDNYPDHPKIIAAGPIAAWLNTCGICYCSRYLTDGFIPDGQVRKLADIDNPFQHAGRLIEVELWERCAGGYRVHDYLKYNPSREQVLREREQTAGRVANWRDRKTERNGVSNGVTNSVSNGDSNAVSTPAPVPVPVPVLNPLPVLEESTKGVREKPRTAPSLTAPTWEAYRAAYLSTYKVEPIRNSKVNGQISQLIGRVGADEAPPLAAWFLSHRGAWYVQQGHSVGALLRDCEKLHTEMCAGTKLHRRDVDEIDRTSANADMWARVEARAEERKRGQATE